MAENNLVHFGILGMKWGIRRYRNKDGTLTDAGKKRYEHTQKEALKKTSDVSELSTEDLQKIVNRLQLEKTYKQLMSELHPKKKGIAAALVRDLAEHAVRETGKAIIGKLIDDKYGTNKNSRKKQESEDDWDGEDTSALSDEELDAKTKRLRTEDEYRKLSKKLR